MQPSCIDLGLAVECDRCAVLRAGIYAAEPCDCVTRCVVCRGRKPFVFQRSTRGVCHPCAYQAIEALPQATSRLAWVRLRGRKWVRATAGAPNAMRHDEAVLLILTELLTPRQSPVS